VRINIGVLSFSLVLACSASAAGTDYRDLDSRVARNANVPAVAKQIVKDPSADPVLADAAREFLAGSGGRTGAAGRRLRKLLDSRAAAQDAADLKDRDAARALAKAAERSPLYSDPTSRQRSNWLSESFTKLGQIPLPSFEHKDDRMRTGGLLPAGIIPFVWGLLIVALLVLIGLAIRHFSWKSGLKRQAKAMLAEDEPERTLDEWLEMAEKLASDGKHREAVRCLYLACLLRFDEHMVARFDRGQTNWEHLARIRASSRLPAGLDFEPPTKRFDTIWYGRRTRGVPDVEQFKDWYGRITQSLAEAKS
jgi:hypothetical protein